MCARHEDVVGSGDTAPGSLKLGRRIRDSAGLYPMKEPQFPMKYGAGWPQRRTGRFGKE